MKERLKILMLGKGGMESALAWKLLGSPRLEALYRAPAPLSGGYIADGVVPDDFDSVKRFIADKGIDMLIAGSDYLIFNGIADALEGLPVKVIAPGAACSRLESSKEWAKEFMAMNAIPTPRFMSVTTDTLGEGQEFLASLNPPFVLKADGPAKGRGVAICRSLADAKDTIELMLGGLFGEASRTVLIEEFVKGRECSVTYALDGIDHLLLPAAGCLKHIGEGDSGPITPGMAAFSPVDFVDDALIAKIEQRILLPSLRGLAMENMVFKGFLTLDIMVVEGEPVLLEYNVRLSDPEAEAILPRIGSDIIEVLEGIADSTLALKRISVSDDTCVAISIVPRIYPAVVPAAATVEMMIPSLYAGDCLLFTDDIYRKEGVLYAGGDRVAVAAAIAPSREAAVRMALDGAERFDFHEKYFRHDLT